YVEDHLKGVRMVEQEATYLVWLDFRGTGLDAEELDQLMIHKAKLWLDSGKIFGRSGVGFQRINVACPREILERALNQIRDALGSLAL
ncbi:MAG: aminotransferase, partial [Lachnospiraceae bacterium]|nr:aminotransferase [Lachnospiraceae bacterium]